MKIETYALFGPSGVGKSTSALSYAYEHNISAIIDDGLLIFKGKKVAGISAKIEKTFVGAIKRAIFFDENHIIDVKNALHLLAIDKVLILGTSKKMVDRIAKNLNLAPIDYYIDIHEVRSSSEIKMALFMRRTNGDHLIPISPIEVEPNIFERFIKRGMQIFSKKRELIGETTIVKPNFHKNSLFISDRVFHDIAEHACSHFPEIVSCDKVETNFKTLPIINIDIKMRYIPSTNLIPTVNKLQHRVTIYFLQCFDIQLESVNIRVKKLVH
jgi:Fe-S cluster assembly ATPase SufC/uncharacterized alkaline shock family protein YloU